MIHPSLLAVPLMFLTVIGFFSFFFFLGLTIDLSTNFPSAPQSIRAVASAIFRPSEVYVPIESLFGDLDCTNTLLIANVTLRVTRHEVTPPRRRCHTSTPDKPWTLSQLHSPFVYQVSLSLLTNHITCS